MERYRAPREPKAWKTVRIEADAYEAFRRQAEKAGVPICHVITRAAAATS